MDRCCRLSFSISSYRWHLAIRARNIQTRRWLSPPILPLPCPRHQFIFIGIHSQMANAAKQHAPSRHHCCQLLLILLLLLFTPHHPAFIPLDGRERHKHGKNPPPTVQIPTARWRQQLIVTQSTARWP